MGDLQIGDNQEVMNELPAAPVAEGPQTKTPRRTARRLERETRLELLLVMY